MKPSWMVLAGALLILSGLANSLIGLRQTTSPFDVVDEQPSTSLDIPSPLPPTSVPISEAVSPSPTTISLSPESSLPTEQPVGLIPDRLVIPSIELDAPIVPTKVKKIEYDGQTYYQWIAPNKPAVGWHDSSALLGLPGNTVLNGHHNVYGEVFKNLVTLHEGDLIQVYSGDKVFSYRVALVLLLPERFKSLSIRLENARWILPTPDERLTLITCWPYQSNTHRVIVVALPVK